MEPKASPARPSLTAEQREQKKSRARAALWTAVNEASQWMALSDIEASVARTLDEIRADAP